MAIGEVVEDIIGEAVMVAEEVVMEGHMNSITHTIETRDKKECWTQMVTNILIQME